MKTSKEKKQRKFPFAIVILALLGGLFLGGINVISANSWIDAGAYIYPNASWSDNVNIINGTLQVMNVPVCLSDGTNCPASSNSTSDGTGGWTNTSTTTTTSLNVGIGTTAPTQKLDVNGSVRILNGNLTLGNSSVSRPYLNFIKGNGFSGGVHFMLEDGTTVRGYVYMDDLEDLRLKGDDVVIEATDNVIIKPRTSNSDVLRLWNNASTSVHEFSISSSNNPFYDMNNAAGKNTVRINSLSTSYFNGGGVSIGTTSSTQKFDVNGTVNVSGPTNPNVMIVDSTNGRLGVNIVPPGQFAVGWPQGNAGGSGATRFDIYGGTSNYRMQIDNNSYLMTIDMFPIGNNATSIRYWRNVNTTGAAYIDLLKADGTANSAIRLRSNGNSWLDGGNVGIGTQAPTQKLDVNGTSLFSNNISTAGTVRFTGFGEGISQLESTGTLYLKAGWDNGGNEDIILLTNTVARMIIKNGGNVGIGIGTGNPNQKLQVNGSINVSNQAYFYSNVTLSSPNGSLWNCGPSNTGVWGCS